MVNNRQKYKSACLYYLVAAITTTILIIAYLMHNWGYAVDDSYITFRYAQNARLGYGFVFNVGERFYGSTATGYAILLAAIARGGDLVGANWTIPNISTVLSCFGVACLTWVYALAVKDPLSRMRIWLAIPALVVGMLFLTTFKVSSLVSGHETYFYVGLVAVAAYLALFRRRLVLAVCILFVATTCRPDVALLALMLFVALALAGPMQFESLYGRVRALILPGLLYVIALAGWLGWTKLYYGSFLPETLKAKEAQVKLGVFETFNARSLASNLNDQLGNSFWLFFLALAVTLVVYVLLMAHRIYRARSYKAVENVALLAFAITMFSYSIALAMAYMMMHVTVWMWYVTPIGLFLLLSGLCAAVILLAPTTDGGVRDA